MAWLPLVHSYWPMSYALSLTVPPPRRIARASLSQARPPLVRTTARGGACASIARPATPVSPAILEEILHVHGRKPQGYAPCRRREESRSPNGKLVVPDNPILPFIEGDGTGPDIWRASVRVMDAAVAKAYGGKRRIHWMEVYAGEKANKLFNTWLPEETVAACREYLVVDQGPADHAGRRRHPLAQRRAAPDARPVRVPAPGALVQGRALARQAPGEGRHGDLPREHRGHLRRHRVRGGHARQRRSSWSCSARPSRRPTPRSASRRPPASASSRSPRTARSDSSAPPSTTRSPTSARA